MADSKSKTVSSRYFAIDEPINDRCPPFRVRHRKSGMCTNWSTRFRNRVAEFQPYFFDEEEFRDYRLRLRRYEADMARRGGDPYAGLEQRRSVFEFDDDADAELAGLAGVGNAG